MKREDFIEYIEFIKSVLEEYLNVVGTDITKRIEENKDKHLKNLKNFPQNGTLEYQYRIGGYLGERLTNVFIYKHFKKVKYYRIEKTEKKYKSD